MSAHLGDLRMLVIDDNPQMRTIIGSVLGAIGVGRIRYAEDGKQALDIVRFTPIDVAYVDYEMPVMGGLEFITATRKLESEARYLPVVMLTGHSFGPSLFAARDAGVTEFLTKPVTAKSILQRLEAIIYRPRPFVKSPNFFGPDRRRRVDPQLAGLQRRRSDQSRDVYEL